MQTNHRSVPDAIPAHQAAESAPSLARLAKLGRESSERLGAIQSLIPEALRPALQAGPIDDKSWCLLVSGNAAAAKIRQLLPLLERQLLKSGWKVNSIRLKILPPKKPEAEQINDEPNVVD